MADKSCEAMNVRFLINRKTQCIVYAEAGKEFVDFLFSFLSMPIGSVLKLMHESESNRKIGSVSNLYDSMAKLPSQFMSTEKSQLLDPKFVTTYSNKSLMIEGGKYYACSKYPETTDSSSGFGSSPNLFGSSSCGSRSFEAPSSLFGFSSCGSSPFRAPSTPLFGSTSYGSSPFGAASTPPCSLSGFGSCLFGAASTPGFSFSSCGSVPRKTSSTVTTVHNMSTSNKDICICGSPINRPLQLRQSTNTSQSGYVKEVFTFIITDDLNIRGSSTSAIMALLNHLNIKDLTELEEWTAIVDRNKALKVLEASLVSTTVLSDVFGPEFSMPAKASSDIKGTRETKTA